MRRILVLCLFATLPLAACSSGVSVDLLEQIDLQGVSLDLTGAPTFDLARGDQAQASDLAQADLSTPARDGGVDASADLVPGPDLTALPDLASPASADLSLPQDLAVAADAGPGADLARSTDLAQPAPDLAAVVDLAQIAPDLAVGPDLAVPVSPDLAMQAGDDLAVPDDLAPTDDLATNVVDDLATETPDLAMIVAPTPDLTMVFVPMPDLAMREDLAPYYDLLPTLDFLPPEDLATPPDLTPVHDMAIAIPPSRLLRFTYAPLNTPQAVDDGGVPLLPPGGEVASSVVAGDFNGDGIDDVATLTEPNGDILIYVSKGRRVFAAPTRTQVLGYSSYSGAITAADINKDGKLDIVLVNASDVVSPLFLGDGNGGLQSPPYYIETGPNPTHLAAADFNNDGYIDIATCSPNELAIDYATSRTAFPAATKVVNASPAGQSVGCQALVASDFDGDGRVDIALTLSSGGAAPGALGILLNKADGFHETDIVVDTLEMSVVKGGLVIAGDVNGDGVTDLVVQSNGSYTDPQTQVSSNRELTTILFGDGHGAFTIASRIFDAPATDVADVNRDGNADLVAPWQVTLGDGQGNMIGSIGLCLPTHASAVGDFDGDSFTDVASGNSSPSDMVVLWNAAKAGKVLLVESSYCYSSGQVCAPPDPAQAGSYLECHRGTCIGRGCVDTGAALADGAPCANGLGVCLGGVCHPDYNNDCANAPAICAPSAHPCHIGYVQAGPRTPGFDNDCIDTGTPVSDGTKCPGGQCTAGNCGP